MHRNSETVSTKQRRIAELANQSPEMAFTSLAYFMDVAWLLEAYIPKGTSTTEVRPIGIPTLEDKILQRAVVMLLEPICEHDFLDCSCGFRPGRSAHQALESLWKRAMDIEGGSILEVDIREFFDNLCHEHMRAFLQRRGRDGVLKKLIHKWLKAGVMEVLPKRFGKYGLTLHPDKTRLIDFTSPAKSVRDAETPSSDGPGSFALLGFTHYWGKSRQGVWVVKRKIASSRFGRAVRSIAHWCRHNRHRPVSEQHVKLRQKLHGHYAYYGITGNYAALGRFKFEVHRRWHKWLNRRNRQRELLWPQFNALPRRFPLPNPRIVHRCA